MPQNINFVSTTLVLYQIKIGLSIPFLKKIEFLSKIFFATLFIFSVTIDSYSKKRENACDILSLL
jgi:hypothetical protein